MASSQESASLRTGALASHFRAAVSHFREMGSPFNAHLSALVAETPDLLALVADAPLGQPPSYLLLGAVHEQVLRAPDSPLARYYPSLTTAPLPLSEIAPAFLDLCASRASEITSVVRTRRVQLTTPSRASLVLPPLVHVAEQACSGESASLPLTLIEVGAAASLLLHTDRYRYSYEGLPEFGGGPAAPHLPPCAYRAMPSPPLLAPIPERRVAVDLHPLDPRSPADRLWAEALLPPDWPDDRRALRACLDLCAETRVETHAGDALDLLPALLDSRGGPCPPPTACTSGRPRSAPPSTCSSATPASPARSTASPWNKPASSSPAPAETPRSGLRDSPPHLS
ncbi:MAG: DUF2332 domain-containing protein [Polyangiaceae bacterium]